MNKYQIVHKHDYGMTVHNFKSEYCLPEIFNSFFRADDDTLAVEFAREVLDIDFDPDTEYLEFVDADMDVAEINAIDNKFLEYL